ARAAAGASRRRGGDRSAGIPELGGPAAGRAALRRMVTAAAGAAARGPLRPDLAGGAPVVVRRAPAARRGPGPTPAPPERASPPPDPHRGRVGTRGGCARAGGRGHDPQPALGLGGDHSRPRPGGHAVTGVLTVTAVLGAWLGAAAV